MSAPVDINPGAIPAPKHQRAVAAIVPPATPATRCVKQFSLSEDEKKIILACRRLCREEQRVAVDVIEEWAKTSSAGPALRLVIGGAA